MTDKKVRQDTLDELLKGSQFEAIPGLDGLNDLVRRCASPDGSTGYDNGKRAARPASLKAENSGPAKSEPPKLLRKTTHYLAVDLYETLNESVEKISGLMSGQAQGRISKSMIINHALHLILHDFEKRGEESALVQQLLKKKGRIPDKSNK